VSDQSGSRTDLEQASPAFADPRPIAHGTVLAGRFVVEKLLGRGGMGVVVRAHDRVLGEPVAIKILRPELAAERRWVDRLAREVKLARQIRHANVCRVFEFGEADGHVFLVMELATGGSLRAELDAGILQARPLADRIADARAITAGLAAIHDAGIVHRDVTSANILRMSDGRPVVSDFGLATDASETTTSIHGGTVAYMAPEVVRGDKATFASDVWSLGLLVHEVVFGVRPLWDRDVADLLHPPAELRHPSDGARRAFEFCVSCTVSNIRRRPRSAKEVLLGWTESRRLPWQLRAAAFVGLAIVATAAAVAGHRIHAARRRTATVTDGIMALEGVPTDWTNVSKVLATIDGKIHCLTALPGDRVLRFVWGVPKRADDLDIATGQRHASALVPATYREGCPDLSPDGKQLVYQGYDGQGRAFIFLSEKADGSQSVPLVASAHPSMDSEPRWLPGGDAFVFDVDPLHFGIYEFSTKRTTVLPGAGEPTAAMFRFMVRSQIFVAKSVHSTSINELVRLSWPSLESTTLAKLPWLVVDWASFDGRIFYSSELQGTNTANVTAIDFSTNRSYRVGFIRQQLIRHLLSSPEGLVFISRHDVADVWKRESSGAVVRLTNDGTIRVVARCRRGGYVAARSDGDRSVVVRLDSEGREVERLSDADAGLDDGGIACLDRADGWLINSLHDSRGIYLCRRADCQRVIDGDVYHLAVSPDERRIAYLAIGNRGPVVRWIASEGGDPHDVAESETGCAPGWSSPQNLWVSRRRNGRVAWFEVDADTGKETGRYQPGAQDCMDGSADPAAPAARDLMVKVVQVSQVRLLPPEYLSR
jgi:hypothetical protein